VPVVSRTISLLASRLQRLADLSDGEVRALSEAATVTRVHEPNEMICEEGALSSHLHILVSGLCHRHKPLPDGSRQITAILLPGDILDLSGFACGRLDHSVAALTRAHTMLLPAAQLRSLIERYPRLGQALWADMARELAIAEQWMVGLGRRTSYSRMAHLLCELYARLELVGIARDHRCALPFTQAELADALGLSCVHLNRTLQQLRHDDLISLKNGHLVIKDWQGLVAAGGFSPIYLLPCARQAAAVA
jgi:CRP-like cAMP-binding protein